jgi:hypothetical protein
MVVYTDMGGYSSENDGFALTDGQGLPLAKIFMEGDAYCYNSPYVSKERGADDFDRHTFRSKKLSTLMSTLKRMNIVTSSDEVLNRIHNQVHSLVNRVVGDFPSRNKTSIDGECVHKLLLAMKDGKSLNDLTQSDRDKYLEILDKYNEADILSSKRKQGVEEMFEDTYLIFGDSLGHYIVADAGYEYDKSQHLIIKPKTPFKRVKDLTGYPRVLSALTMNKVHLGEEFRPFNKDSLVPLGDRFNSDLELVYGYRSRNSIFDMGYLCLSK